MKYKLKELVKIKYGKSQKLVEDNKNGNYPILGTGGIIGYATNFLYDKSSVLIGRKGTIDKIRYVDYPFWAIDTLFYTEINEKLVLPQYLYYRLLDINFNNLNEGTTIPSLRTQTLYEIELDIDSLGRQKKIINILSLIDKKIELNTKINNSLYEIASSLLFKDFEKKQEKVKIQDIITFTKGKKPLKICNIKQKHYLKYLTIACLNNQEITYAETDKAVIANNDILMVMDGASSGEVYYSSHGIVASTLAKINVVNDNYKKEFIYFILKKYSKLIKNKITGSAIPHTDKSFVNTLEVPNIPKETQEKYKDILNIIQHNTKEIINLSTCRNILLPKLVNGEINLEKIKI